MCLDCVGYKNHPTFIYFLAASNVTILLLFVSLFIYYQHLPTPIDSSVEHDSHTFFGLPTLYSLFPGLELKPWFFAWNLHYIIYLMLLTSLLYQHLSLIRQNLTINEAINWYKYDTFQDPHGSFINPYDHGTTMKNCKEFFCSNQEMTMMNNVIEQQQQQAMTRER